MFVAAAFLAASVQAQDLKISLNKKGKVGFVDSQGNVVVKCIYDSATPFEKGIVLTIDWYLNHEEWMEHITSGNYQKYYEEMYKNK